jgi:hypothetical protein
MRLRLNVPCMLEKYAGAPIGAIPQEDLRAAIHDLNGLFHALVGELRRRESRDRARADRPRRAGAVRGQPGY